LRLAGALAGYWEIRARFIEGLAALSRGLTLDVLHPEPDMSREGQLSRARALAGAGHLAWRASDYLLAHSFLNRGLDLFERLQDSWGLAYTLECLGRLSLVQGDPDRCQRYISRGLELSRQIRDDQRIMACLVTKSWLELNTGRYETVMETLSEVLTLSAKIEDIPHRTLALNFMGYASYLMEDLHGAQLYLDESVPLTRAANLSWEYGMATAMRGNVRRRRDDFAGARADLREGLKMLHRIGAGWEVAIVLDYFSFLEIEEFAWERGAMLMGAAEGLRRSINQPLQPSLKADNEHFMSRLMNSLDEQTFQMAHRRGLHLPLERAVALALEKS
jgi:tetratricopeptide (TPR) repeat protein